MSELAVFLLVLCGIGFATCVVGATIAFVYFECEWLRLHRKYKDLEDDDSAGG